MTLNAGFSSSNEEKISEDDKKLIADFIRTKGVTKLPPASASSNEATRATNELVAQKRREFRANRRKENKTEITE